MEVQSLVHTTGLPLADHTVLDILHLFTQALPNAICSCYVEGSYAHESAVATSDLDLILVLHAPISTIHEQAMITALLETCQQRSPLELDITVTDRLQLQHAADPSFKLGARLLFGSEIRDTIPLLSITLWARERMHAAFSLMIHVFQRSQPVISPLSAPKPDDPFYGYAARPMRLADGTEIQTTRNLMRVTGWIATARIAYQSQCYVVDKRACVATYRDTIGDEWTTLLETIDQQCRQAWQYRIPESTQEQNKLRTITRQVLGYENHFLGIYTQFLYNELTSNDLSAQVTALSRLEQTWYPEAGLLGILDQLVRDDHPDVRCAAQRLITQWQARASTMTK